ncbi:hypothetical protein P692DRAFT_201800228 [Suillus brevipes Sb2]|nr:hypothetical protein P692DRAFT_201800228 [Suillus brevipes Sb2]
MHSFEPIVISIWDAANIFEYVTTRFTAIWMALEKSQVSKALVIRRKFVQHIIWEAEMSSQKFVFPFINICTNSNTSPALPEYLNDVMKMLTEWQSVAFAGDKGVYVFGLYDGNFTKLKDDNSAVVKEYNCKSVIGHAAVNQKRDPRLWHETLTSKESWSLSSALMCIFTILIHDTMVLSADLTQHMRSTRVFFTDNLEASVREVVLDKVPHTQEKQHEKNNILRLCELAERLMEVVREAEGDVGDVYESAMDETDDIAAEAERVFFEVLKERFCVAIPLCCVYGGGVNWASRPA